MIAVEMSIRKIMIQSSSQEALTRHCFSPMISTVSYGISKCYGGQFDDLHVYINADYVVLAN